VGAHAKQAINEMGISFYDVTFHDLPTRTTLSLRTCPSQSTQVLRQSSPFYSGTKPLLPTLDRRRGTDATYPSSRGHELFTSRSPFRASGIPLNNADGLIFETGRKCLNAVAQSIAELRTLLYSTH
jgi:hypothetical protein